MILIDTQSSHCSSSRRRFLQSLFATGAGAVASIAPSGAATVCAPSLARRQRFRVLSLDGGGARGYLSAAILENLEKHLNTQNNNNLPIGKRFDLITGTSTGGIIALGLANGRSASDIRAFYEKHIPEIFSSSQRAWRTAQWYKPKYETTRLRSAVEQFFGSQTLENTVTDVCITSVALRSGKPRFYKSDYLVRNKGRLDEKLSDIALATSAAPTYFKAHSLKHSDNLVDGGICANNPSVIAIIESFQFERPSKRGIERVKNIATDMDLLSIGTGEQPSMPYDLSDVSNGGKLNWAAHISDIILESQSQLIHVQAKLFLGDNYLRINPQLKFAMSLDDVERLHELKNLVDITKEYENFMTRFK